MPTQDLMETQAKQMLLGGFCIETSVPWLDAARTNDYHTSSFGILTIYVLNA